MTLVFRCMLSIGLMHISVFGMQRISKPVARKVSAFMVRHCASKNNFEKENESMFKDLQEALGIKDAHYLYGSLGLFIYTLYKLIEPKPAYRYYRSRDQ